MSRRRYISTDISTDPKVADLAEEGGAFPVLLYTWLIPHLDDWGRAPGDPKEIRLMVLPGFPCTSKDVEQALELMQKVGLIYRYEVAGKKYLCVNPETFYKHQSYIQQKKRKDDSGSKYPRPDGPWGEYFAKQEEAKSGDSGVEQHEEPQNTVEQQQTETNNAQRRTSPQNTASPSPSPSEDLSGGGGEIYAHAREENASRLETDSNFAQAYKIFTTHFFHADNDIQRDMLAGFVDAGLEPAVIEKAAKITRANGKDLKYFWGILRNCVNRGTLTLEAFEQDQERYEKWRAGNATHWARNRGDPGASETDVAVGGYFSSIPGLIRTV